MGKFKEKWLRMNDAFDSHHYEEVIALADELLSLLNVSSSFEGAEEIKMGLLWKKAISYYFNAEEILDNDLEGDKKEEIDDLLRHAIRVFYDFGNEFGWDDSVIWGLMASFDYLGEMTKARNLSIYLLGSQKYRDCASGVYKRNTDKVFHLFCLHKDNAWYEEIDDKWKNNVELVELEKQHAIGFKFTNAISYEDRKYVYIGRNQQQISGTYQFFDEKRVVNWIFTLDRLPPDMVFPLGRPQPGLYMAHPIRTDHYYPMKGVEETLFMEKVREFCWLVQCLGATRVSFHSNKGLSVSQGMGSTMNIDAKVGIKSVNISGGYGNTVKRDDAYTSNQQVELVQNFAPKKKAYCPDDLIWLDTDPAWQMLLKQRLEGGIMEYTYKISSSETCQISTSEMESVKANFEYIMIKANGEYNANTDKTFSSNEETEWSIHVEFAPLEELLEQQSSNNNGTLKLTDDESEYLDMVKECLEDGEIGNRERKLLDKIRIKNGISEERAKELESTLTVPQLTDDEKEYLEAFKDACEDGKVSDKQRRLLEKLRVMYGISKERARELEMNR